MKINWTTVSSVTAALTGLLTISLVPLAQSWMEQKFQLQQASIEKAADAKYETQVAHETDLNRIAAATEKLTIQSQNHESRIQRIEDVQAVVSRRKNESQN